MTDHNSEWISASLAALGVRRGDILFIHGDAGVAAQLRDVQHRAALDCLFNEIEAYLGEDGTLIIPSFTYSATKNEIYDPASTKCAIGLFSEAFRQRPGVKRSLNPIFSVCASGKHAEEFQKSRVDDCFGADTAFDLLYGANAIIVTMGFDIKKGITFTHYVEQKLKVKYRYMKTFQGRIKQSNGDIHDQTVTYYVRDISFRTNCNLTYFRARAHSSGKLTAAPFGRFPATAIRAQDFFNLASVLLKENEFSLIDCFQSN